MQRLLLSLALSSAACGPVIADLETEPDVGSDVDTDADTDDELEPRFGPDEVGGGRPVEVLRPDDYDGVEPLPLVILLHGYTNSPEFVDDWLRMSDRVDGDRFFLLVPEGLRDAAGQPHWNWYDPNGPDDEAYLVGLIDEMQEGWRVDPDQVVVVGHSNGGFMSYRLACEHADRVSAIVPIAGLLADPPDACQPSEAVSIVHVHGTWDAVVPYGGNPFFGPGAEEITQDLAARFSCEAGEADSRRDLVKPDGFDTEVTLYDVCEDGATVQLWTIRGGSHLPQWRAGVAEQILDEVLDSEP